METNRNRLEPHLDPAQLQWLCLSADTPWLGCRIEKEDEGIESLHQNYSTRRACSPQSSAKTKSLATPTRLNPVRTLQDGGHQAPRGSCAQRGARGRPRDSMRGGPAPPR